MPAGELRELVAFDSRGVVSDGYGNDVAGPWMQQFVVPARIQPMKGIGSETMQAARLAGQSPAIIRVRLSSQTRQITPDWQARNVRDGTAYNIREVANLDEHGAYLDILAQAGEATG